MIKDLLKEGFIKKSKGYYKQAIESFYKALELDNTSSELILEIAECYFYLNDEERTLSYIEQILNEDPAHIESLKLLKKIFIKRKAWKEAVQTAKNIFSISNSTEDLEEILNLFNKSKNFNEVFEYNTEINSAEILYQKAYAKLQLNEPKEAENYINEALKIESDNKKLLLKSKIIFKLNKQEEATEILNKINLDSSDVDTLNFAGIVKQYECKFTEAISLFKEALKLDSTNHELYYNCASTYFKLGNIQLAKKYYNLAILHAPDNPNYHFALANLYYSEKQYKRALEELDLNLFEAKLLKAIILYDSGYLAIAKRELENLYNEQPENELIINYRNKIDEELKI